MTALFLDYEITGLTLLLTLLQQTPTQFAGRPLNVAFAGNAKPVDGKKPRPRGGKRKK